MILTIPLSILGFLAMGVMLLAAGPPVRR